jgi:ATP-dependent helicase/nuclease subunit B
MTHLFTIPSNEAFGAALARGLWDMAAGDSFALSNMRVFLPTRRACREIRTDFLRLTEGKPLLLPRLSPLGDVDEVELAFEDADLSLPPAIAPLRRQLLLMRLIRQKDASLGVEQAADLAQALARLLDQAEIEGANFADLEKLVAQGNLAVHWQETVAFLKIVTDAWPRLLAEQNLLDPAERRNLLLRAQARAWRKNPVSYPVIIAGSTGSVPAVADLIEAVAQLPNGIIVLPGLDRLLDEEAWQKAGEVHPQFGMKRLLEKLKAKRADVALWPAAKSSDNGRLRLLSEAMRPSETTEAWRDLTPEQLPPAATEGMEALVLDHPQEEAEAIALRLRAQMQEPEKTALLVTPDRGLALRVVASLRRWGIEANDSAGSPLSTTPVGSFLSALLEAAAPAPSAISILGFLKHPLAACGLDESKCRSNARSLETNLWRGPRRTDGWDAVKFLRDESLKSWAEKTAASFAPLAESWNDPLPMADRLSAHLALAEKMAATDRLDGASRLWQGTQGEAAAEWLDQLRQASSDYPALSGDDYAALFTTLMRQVPVRSPYAAHARIQILGPLEARLQAADLTIIASLNEGAWPTEAQVDPWMSRPMQAQFGLPLPERRLGLSAHDFVQLAAAPHVFMTRSKRMGGAPAVPSRFWLQIEAVLQASRRPDALKPSSPWQEWARQLDKPLATEIKPCDPPAPCPPVAARPTSLSVTEIGTWMKNPYAIYARRILKLEKLDQIDQPLDASDRGNILHKALENFCRAVPEPWGDDALPLLLDEGRKIFAPYQIEPQVAAFWWPRFETIAAWFIDTMRQRQAEGLRISKVEAGGERFFAQGRFRLHGRADRIDLLPDGSLAIVDYKSTTPPSGKQVFAGYEPQLPLLALIAADGGMREIPPTISTELAYWFLGGGATVAEEKRLKPPYDDLLVKSGERLETMVDLFAQGSTPYLAQPLSKYRAKYDDYAHLSRQAEWNKGEGDE